MKSIMHDKRDGTCYLCMAAGDYSRKTTLEEHHCIHGWANRRLSERWGLKVYLCPAHHRHLHDDKDGNIADAYIKMAAQRAFAEKYPGMNFLKIFGKNFDEEPLKDSMRAASRNEEKDEEAGFWLIPEQVTEISI